MATVSTTPMNYTVLIFCPGDESYVGLWQSQSKDDWTRIPLAKGAQTGPDIIQSIDQLLNSHHLKLNDLTHIGAMVGPASYTQLRLFVATANTLAWALQKPLFGFSKEADLPHDLPSLLPQAKHNVPLEPVYPHALG
jgi:hypothetical protein